MGHDRVLDRPVTGAMGRQVDDVDRGVGSQKERELTGQGLRILLDLGQISLQVHHGDIARIEVEPGEIARLAAPEIRRQVTEKFKALHYLYIALDLNGYRTGSMNAVLEETRTE